MNSIYNLLIYRIHKWRTRGKKLVPSHKGEALEDKQKLQMKTFSELAECLARIPPKITLYGLLFKYNYVGCLLLLMFSSDLLFAIKRDAYIVKETGWFCKFPKYQKLDKWAMAAEKRQKWWPKLHIYISVAYFLLSCHQDLFIFLFYRIVMSWLSYSVSVWSMGQHVCLFSSAIAPVSLIVLRQSPTYTQRHPFSAIVNK